MAEPKEIIDATERQLREARRQVKKLRADYSRAKTVSDSAKVRLENKKDLVIRLNEWMVANETST